MARLSEARKGQTVTVRTRPLRFSYWPMFRGTHRYGLQSSVFATDPWAFIISAIKERCAKASLNEAIASISQARYFYDASVAAQVLIAKPLLNYYCFMNLAKAYCLTQGIQPSFDKAHHGLSERIIQNGRELIDAYLNAYVSPNPRTGGLNLFDEFLSAVSGNRLTADSSYNLMNLLPQVVTGHRLWKGASGKKERFIAIERIEIAENKTEHEIWLRLYIFSDDLRRIDVNNKDLLIESGLNNDFQQVKCGEKISGRTLLCFEQSSAERYTHRAADQIQKLVSKFKASLWVVVTTIPPYRKYYLYICPRVEHNHILPQLLSSYAIMFYFGMITRYRPHHFDEILKGAFSSFCQEFIGNQSNQFIYLLASEFALQEVTRPAII